MALEIEKEKRKRMVTSIKRYFGEEMEQEITNLKADLLLEFCLRELCPTVYNQAIQDAQAYLLGRVEDLEGSCFELEFDFWDESAQRNTSS